LGAPNKCTEEDQVTLKRIVSELEEKNLMTIPMIYDENIHVCYQQLVSG